MPLEVAARHCYAAPMNSTSAPIDEPLDELRPRLVRAMLPHVAFDGWTPRAVAAGALDAGIDPDIAAIAFESPAAMVSAYIALADADMVAALDAANIGALKVRERITLALRTRLDQAAPHREAVRRALAVLALPANLPLAARTLWHTADAMWHAAGDTATDFNHYTKRMTLGAVYSACLLYWLDDESDGSTATHAFIDRRIDGVMRFEKLKGQLKRGSGNAPSLARFLGRLRYPAV
jgi:ubiquinone biosynthesis protein COQ9